MINNQDRSSLHNFIAIYFDRRVSIISLMNSFLGICPASSISFCLSGVADMNSVTTSLIETRYAHLASTRPAPVALSLPGPAVSPVPLVPVLTSRAEFINFCLTWAGVRLGFFSSIKAITPATCGHAAEVPLKRPQPSSGAPVDGVILSRSAFGCTGSMMLGALVLPPMLTALPVRPQRSGQ